MSETIETTAVALRPDDAIGQALTIEELHEQLDFIRQVMAREMKDGEDYGKIPGCGDKPGLFQPGAQKLCMTFQLTDHVKSEEVKDLPHPSIWGHREYKFTLSVRSKTGREWDGVGTCTTLESKYRYRGGARKCPECGREAIIKGRAEYGGGWLCFQKKGGCGAKWPDGAAEIENQSVERVEHDNPADYWNTVQKMAFKRALVHATINATNTSMLWSQDLEDLAANQSVETPEPTKATPPKTVPKPTTGPREQDKGDKAALLVQLRKLCGNFEGELVRWLRECPGKSGNVMLMPNEGLEDMSVVNLRAIVNGWDKGYPKIEEWLLAHPKPSDHDREQRDPEWWRGVIVPIPRKGQKRDEYLKAPDTLGSLYEARHDDEAARARLFGFVDHFEPQLVWKDKTGKEHTRSESEVRTDQLFRQALDALADWREKHEEQPVETSGMPMEEDVPF